MTKAEIRTYSFHLNQKLVLQYLNVWCKATTKLFIYVAFFEAKTAIEQNEEREKEWSKVTC